MSESVWVKPISIDDLTPVTGLQGIWHRYVDAQPGNDGMIFGMGAMMPGEAAGWHIHPEPEIFFVLTGQGEARWRDGDEECHAELRPGVAFYKVGNVAHQMINTGDSPLTGVYFKLAVR